jgi:hypothetical protein
LRIEVTLLNIRRRNNWGNVLKALEEVTKNLPIPSTPVSQAGSYVLELTNSALDGDLQDQDPNSRATTAELVLNFDPTGQCSSSGGSDFENTGTLAVVQASGVPGPGLVQIRKTNEYCWHAELRPAFVLKAAPKRSGVECGDPSYDATYEQVTNDYVGFYINSRPVPGPHPEFTKDALEVEALQRCRAHGLTSTKDCFGE